MGAQIHSCKSVLHVYGIKAIGSKMVPVIPVVSSKLHMSLCMPNVLNGCEIMDSNIGSLYELENFHVPVAINLQGLPDQAVNLRHVIMHRKPP